MSLDFAPAFDLDGALDRARADDRPRRRRRAPASAACRERATATLPARRRARSPFEPGPDRDAGGARRRPLHPAPVLPPGVHAARQLQGVHGQGRTAA
ncbi:MAG: hypothetical protein MZV70_33915 [Desulfobacterales bacterium]|nr:hypothetical protein [Desulfobacterales bacterium]